MHESSINSMSNFLKRFNTNDNLNVLEVGSRQVRKKKKKLSYKNLIPSSWNYVGIDIVPGENVDIVLKDPYCWNLNKLFDLIISGQVLEHVGRPWEWIREIYKNTAVGGYVCIIAPSAGKINSKKDYWRIQPDGMRELLYFAGFKDIDIEIKKNDNHPWKDCIGIAKK